MHAVAAAAASHSLITIATADATRQRRQLVDARLTACVALALADS